MQDAKVQRLVKALGRSTVEEMDALDKEALRTTIISAESAMKQAKEELDDNPRYQSMKEAISDLAAGMKDVNKRQRAIIQYALLKLEETEQ